MTIIFEAKKYKDREDLEAAIGSALGKTADQKDCIVTGKREDLKILFLNDRSTVWGCKCEITDTPTQNKKESKVHRGEKFPSGINL